MRDATKKFYGQDDGTTYKAPEPMDATASEPEPRIQRIEPTMIEIGSMRVPILRQNRHERRKAAKLARLEARRKTQ